jgi:hypothetical protein
MEAPSRNAHALQWSVVLLVLNFIGAVIYVFSASNGWRIPQERGVVPVSGEPFVWFIAVAPVCAVFIVLNLTWGAFILARKRWRSGIFCLSIIPIWLIAVAIDFAHH